MILVPYGKEQDSIDALRYALEATNPFRKLPIVCFRATESNLGIEALDLLKSELTKEVETISADFPDIDVRAEVWNGNYEDAIHQFMHSETVDFVIVGVRKTRGMQRLMYEGKAGRFLRGVKAPILVIPEGYQYKPIEIILFASDFKPIKNDNALDPLVEIAEIRNAEVRIAHVRTEKRHLTEDEVMEMHRESSLFGENVKHSFKHIFRSSISNGIDYYLKLKGDNDILVLVKREKGFMSRQFGRDHALEFALHPTLPILILHEGG